MYIVLYTGKNNFRNLLYMLSYNMLPLYIYIYYMDKGILLGTKTLVLIIRHYIRELSGVFSVCHA